MGGGGRVWRGHLRRAAVDPVTGTLHAGQLLERVPDRLLNRTLGIDIDALGPQVFVELQEARVLARTLIMNLLGFGPLADQRLLQVAVAGPFTPADEVVVALRGRE